uniref:Uncharacterized protein n=1 Tax=Anguilla anguilla TaxID=7936 RepID=A0A0E9S217_ANGAN
MLRLHFSLNPLLFSSLINRFYFLNIPSLWFHSIS